MVKAIAAVILCIIVLVQYFVGIRSCIRERLGCLGVTLFTAWTLFLFLLFWLAGVFDF